MVPLILNRLHKTLLVLRCLFCTLMVLPIVQHMLRQLSANDITIYLSSSNMVQHCVF